MQYYSICWYLNTRFDLSKTCCFFVSHKTIAPGTHDFLQNVVKDVILVYIIVAVVRGNKFVAKVTYSEVENTMKLRALRIQYAADCGNGQETRWALWIQTTMEQTLMFPIKLI